MMIFLSRFLFCYWLSFISFWLHFFFSSPIFHHHHLKFLCCFVDRKIAFANHLDIFQIGALFFFCLCSFDDIFFIISVFLFFQQQKKSPQKTKYSATDQLESWDIEEKFIFDNLKRKTKTEEKSKKLKKKLARWRQEVKAEKNKNKNIWRRSKAKFKSIVSLA